MSVSRSLSALVVAFSLVSGNSAGAKDRPETDPIIVDMHAIILADVSGSMNPPEYKSMKEGLAKYFLSQTALEDYSAGTCIATTMIHFAVLSEISETQIICTKEAAEAFVEQKLWYQKNDGPAGHNSNLGSGTQVGNAFDAAFLLLKDEASLSIVTGRREVILLGDDMPAEQGEHVREVSDSLTTLFGARVSVIAVDDIDKCVPNYRQFAITQPGMKHTDSYGFTQTIQAGIVAPAIGTQSVERAVGKLLSFTRF